ncbi:neutral zinc metallopeptidase [Verrucomicrobium sp. BvORR034]|uniref:KPN_02809 family neutral zinc metallopeptidase n=1 Tax=Verrucomicrobium sp. BvORR034 TaxID=1396418 RepID=UPI00067985C4|nr:neutral zinc metallopeptidase [Verrucomicrobium sp. BvORR034]
MDWEKGEQSSNLEDRRRMRPKAAVGGGLGLLAILAIGYFLGVDPQQLSQLMEGVQNSPTGQTTETQGPLTPEEERSRRFAATILGFTEKVWEQQFRTIGRQYDPPRMVLFTEGVETRCGLAPAAVGPFYCPADQTVYLDPTFFNELQQQLGGSAADFSQAYVIAHEVGHHVQNLLGYSSLVDQKRDSVPEAEFNRWSVRLELQADYLAGVWAHYGQQQFNFIEEGDVESAIKSANAIGDDRLQRRAGRFNSPEKYTHGTSEQRVKWFIQGLKTGDMGTVKRMFEMPYEDL